MKLGVKTTKMAAAFMQQKITFYVQPKDLLGEGKKHAKTYETKHADERTMDYRRKW